MQMLEPVEVATPLTCTMTCPFDHGEKKRCTLENELPPNEANDSRALRKSLAGGNAREAALGANPVESIERDGERTVVLAAHHLLPGNESLKHTRLHRWIDTFDGVVDGDIGYRVNHHTNGAWLVGSAAFSGSWTGMSERVRRAYAFDAMRAMRRQFHDRHPAYSEWVVQALNKIASKFESGQSQPKDCGQPGCAGARKKPYGPAHGALTRMHELEIRLHGLVVADPQDWRKPVLTSRYALMLHDSTMQADAARRELSAMREAMAAGRPLSE